MLAILSVDCAYCSHICIFHHLIFLLSRVRFWKLKYFINEKTVADSTKLENSIYKIILHGGELQKKIAIYIFESKFFIFSVFIFWDIKRSKILQFGECCRNHFPSSISCFCHPKLPGDSLYVTLLPFYIFRQDCLLLRVFCFYPFCEVDSLRYCNQPFYLSLPFCRIWCCNWKFSSHRLVKRRFKDK